jgi:phosphotriesterase-related protein
MTVTGPVAAVDLGLTLPHEHVFFDLGNWQLPAPAHKQWLADATVRADTFAEVYRDPMVCRDNLVFADETVAAQELRWFREAGGGTIVDVSLASIGRDAAALRRLSEATGVRIVAGCGWYVQPTHTPDIAAATEEELAARLVAEIRDGIDGTGVRPGIIGELGISDGIHPDEAKALRAAALAQQETGLAITIHCPIPHEQRGPEIVAILAGAGADPTRVILGHQSHTAHDLDYQRACADTGATVEFDRFGAEFLYESWGGYREPRDQDVVAAIARLVADGYGDRILVSHDACYRAQLRSFGGAGYAHVPVHVTRWLEAAGVSAADIRTITVSNPARLLAAAPVPALIPGGQA